MLSACLCMCMGEFVVVVALTTVLLLISSVHFVHFTAPDSWRLILMATLTMTIKIQFSSILLST